MTPRRSCHAGTRPDRGFRCRLARSPRCARGDRAVGAVAAFIGTVRDVKPTRPVASMTLEHYPGMTEKALAAIVDEAKARWDIFDALVIHRVGALEARGPDRAGRR